MAVWNILTVFEYFFACAGIDVDWSILYKFNPWKENAPLLEAMKQSLKFGTAADKFLSDSDFKDCWNDAEFKNTLVIESQVDTKTKSTE